MRMSAKWKNENLVGNGPGTVGHFFWRFFFGHAFAPVSMEAGLESVRSLWRWELPISTHPLFMAAGFLKCCWGWHCADVPRERFTISTKLGRYDEDTFDFRPQRVVESIDTSLFRLGLDHLDIVFLHDVEFTDFRATVAEAMPALKREQEKGKVRYIGIAGYPFKPVRWVLDHYDIDVTLNYNHFTLQNRRLVTDLLPQLKQHGVGVLNASPFAQRLLTHTELPFWHPASAEVRTTCRRAVKHCRERGIDAAKLCVQFSTRHPDLTTCVIGSGNPDNVRNWCQWIEQPYEADAIAEVEQILQNVLNRNSVYGLPENNDTDE